MATYQINSLKQTIESFNKLVIDNDYVFRGVNERKQLLPKILRKGDYSNNEFEILEDFEQFYGAYSSTTISNCWEFLALAQHYGLMTRLIDFSLNPFVALFFALHTKKVANEKYRVYALRKSMLKDLLKSGLTRYPVDNTPNLPFDTSGCLTLLEQDQKSPFTNDIKDFLKQLANKPGLFYLSPNYKNNRVLMQQGLFLMPKDLEEEDIYSMYDSEMDVYEIDESIREETLKYLDSVGYNEFKLMPDLSSLCYEINHKIMEK